MTKAAALVGAALLALLFAGLGRLPLIDPDEGRYARTAQEMIQRDDLVVPWLDGQPRLKKPVFFYWCEIASFRLLGESETAARLPSAAAAAGTLLWLFSFTRSRLGESTALAACTVLATTPLFFGMARTTTTDMTLTFFVFGAAASLYSGIVEPVRSIRNLIIGGVCLGLGLLTKGPVALLFPGLAIGAAVLARRRAPITVAGRVTAAAWIMIAVVVPWLALLFHRMGFEETLEIWRRETLERISGGLDHPESPVYYLMTSPATFFPWSAFVPFALVSSFRRLRRGDGMLPFLLAWTIGSFVFFSIGRGKLDSYLLPLTPAVAILLATTLSGELIEPAVLWGGRVMLALGVALLIPVKLGHSLHESAGALGALSLTAAAFGLVIAGLAYAAALTHARLRVFVQPALASLTGAALLAAVLFLPAGLAEARSTRALVRDAGLAASDETVFAHRIHHPSLGFYLRRAATFIPSRNLLLKAVADGKPAAVLVEERRRDVVLPLLTSGFRVAARSDDRIVLRRTATKP